MKQKESLSKLKDPVEESRNVNPIIDGLARKEGINSIDEHIGIISTRLRKFDDERDAWT